MKNYTLVCQTEERDCGLASLNMLLLYYGETFSLDYLKELCNYKNLEMDFYNLSLIAQALGYTSNAYHINDLNDICHTDLPCIAQIEISEEIRHFVVIFDKNNEHVIIGDPAKKTYTTQICNLNKCFTGYILRIENKITV